MSTSTSRLATAKRATLAVCLGAALAAGAAAKSTPHPNANTIPVTKCADDNSGGTLREAVAAAGDGDTIDMTGLQCSTITLLHGSLVTQATDLTLLGSGMDALTIDGNNASRIIAGQNLTISDLTIAHGAEVTNGNGGCIATNGDLTLTHARLNACIVSGAANAAGGAASVLGNLTMDRSEITSSHVSSGNLGLGGGAAVGGNATLRNSTLRGNTVDSAQNAAYGGGLFVDGATELHASTIDANTAHASAGVAYGGGIHAPQADVSVLDGSTISGNTAVSDTASAYGGGIRSGASSNPVPALVTIDHSTIDGNDVKSSCASCVVSGGGVNSLDSITVAYAAVINNQIVCESSGSDCTAGGGGLSSFAQQVASHIHLRNATVSVNTAIGGTLNGAFAIGGGVFGAGGIDLVAHNSTIAFNFASTSGGGISVTSLAPTSELVSTIVASNDTDTNPDDVDSGPFPNAITFGGSNNDIMTVGASVTVPADTITDDPLLLSLTAAEGNGAFVHPLDVGSPAIDAGANPDALACDQRGFPYRRVEGTQADIGAYETQEHALFADSFENGVGCP
jgi:hypothetical protein